MVAQRHIIITIIFSSLFFLASLNTYAENLDALADGQAAFSSGKYEEAAALWRIAALQGNSHAQVLSGLAYANGWGVAKDMSQAEMWYHIAAESNNATGQFLLGLYYITRTDAHLLKVGITWIKRSAENGDATAKGFLLKAERKHWFANVEGWESTLAGKKFAANAH